MGKRVMLSKLERALDASVTRRQAEKALLHVTDPSEFYDSKEVREVEDGFIRAKLRERSAWRALAEEQE